MAILVGTEGLDLALNAIVLFVIRLKDRGPSFNIPIIKYDKKGNESLPLFESLLS